MAHNQEVKPVLKWAGGKRQLVPEIKQYYKSLKPKKYIEPFFGGGAVYFDILKTLGTKYKETAIINDVNQDLIELYRNIKISPEELVSLVDLLSSICDLIFLSIPLSSRNISMDFFN